MLLKQYPVVVGQTFKIEARSSCDNVNTWDEIDSELYFVKENQGIVELVSGEFRKLPKHYRITYTAGYDFNLTTTFLESCGAGDLEYACWNLISNFYSKKKGGDNIKSENIGNYSVTFADEVYEDPELKRILDKYCRPSLM